jgi:uncharacterized membrane protein YdjX (TVP38/TMEM64 family)
VIVNGRRFPTVRLLAAVAIVAGLIVAHRERGQLPAFFAWIDGLGAWGPAAFIAGYALATVALVPGSLLTLAAGAIFGVTKGTAIVLVAATLGASLAFLVARYLARGPVERWLAGNERLAAMDRAIAGDGFRVVLLLRLVPFVPFNLLNYALGLTSVRFGEAVLASVGMLPGTLLYVYTGAVVGDLARLAGGAAAHYAVLTLGLVASLILATLLTRRARRALHEATDGPAVG